MVDFDKSCNRFCAENICKLLWGIVAAGFAVFITGFGAWLALDRANTGQEQINMNTVVALETIVGEQREQSATLIEIQKDMAFVKGQMGAPQTAFVPGPLVLARPSPPTHQ
jgi:hypothetical protein